MRTPHTSTHNPTAGKGKGLNLLKQRGKKMGFAALIAIPLLLSSCGKKTQETKVAREDITEMVFASGILEPEDKYNLVAQTEGYLIALSIKEGDIVSAGQVLAVIDNAANQISAGSAQQLVNIARSNAAPDAPALQQVQANIQAAAAKYAQDSLQAERYKRLHAARSISQVEYENAQLAATNSRSNLLSLREQYEVLRTQANQQVVIQKSQADINSVMQGNNAVKAILAGRVYKKMKQLGDYVRRGEVIAVIGHADALYAKLSIDESNISKLKPGQTATIALNTDKSRSWPARITEIYPSFDEMSQSFTCEAHFDSVPSFRISGTQLEANVLIGKKQQVLVIPRNYMGYANKVKVKRDGKWQEVVIEPGFVSSEWVEVVSGLAEGEEVQTDRVK